MFFIRPWALLGLTAVVIAALWALFRPGRSHYVVGSITLWRKAIDSLDSSRLRRARRISIAWIFLLAGAVAGVCAITRPVYYRTAPARRLAMMLYPSAEIATERGIADLRQSASAFLDRLDEHDRVRLVFPLEQPVDADWMSPSQAQKRLADLRAIAIASGGLTFPQIPDDVRRVYCFAPAGADVPVGPNISLVEISPVLGPVTADALGAEILDDKNAEVFLSLRNQTDSPWAGTVSVEGYDASGSKLWSDSGKLVGVEPRKLTSVVLRCRRAEIIGVTARGPMPKNREADCVVYLVHRRAALRKVAITGRGEPMLRRFVQADKSLELVGKVEDADVVIANGVAAPAGQAAIVINPPSAPPGWRKGKTRESVVLDKANLSADDTVMRNVDLRGVAVRRMTPWIGGGRAELGYKSLAVFNGEAIILRRREGETAAPGRIYLAFDVNIDNTNFTMADSFVIFFANAVRSLCPAGRPWAGYEYISPLQAGADYDGKPLMLAPHDIQAGRYPLPGVYKNQSGRLLAVNLTGLHAARAKLPPQRAVAELILPKAVNIHQPIEFWPILVMAAIIFWLTGWAIRSR